MTHADRTLAENTILALAARKFIYKSEMRALLSSLGDKSVTLLELETLLFSLIDITVIYVDDDPVNPDAYVSAVSLKRKLKQTGYDSLGEYVDVNAASLAPLHFPEIVLFWEGLAADERPPFSEELGEILADPQLYEQYLLIETADFFFEALDRISDGENVLDPDGRDLLVDRIAEHMGTSAKEAEALLTGGLREMGIQTPDSGMSWDSCEQGSDRSENHTVNPSADRDRRE